MARFFDIHPHDPQPRAIGQVVAMLRDGALIAYPTDSGYALGCQVGNAEGKDRITAIRHLDDKHHFTIVCRDFGQLGQLVQALLEELGEPLLTSSLILPDEETPMTDGWQVKEELDHQVDAVIDGECLPTPTTVIDYSSGVPEVTRLGAGDPTPFV